MLFFVLFKTANDQTKIDLKKHFTFDIRDTAIWMSIFILDIELFKYSTEKSLDAVQSLGYSTKFA